jgi:hypothetical protein
MTDAQAALAEANSALQAVAAAVAEMDATLNSLSLDRDALAEANIALQAQLDTAYTELAKYKPKTVLDYGAKGDGLTLCNAAFIKAAATGEVIVPAGRYLLDPTPEKQVILSAGCKVTFEPDVVLVAKPNSAPKYAVLTAQDDVTITGDALIQGERLLHTYTAGSTHEWGYGLKITGNRVKVNGLRVVECTGDGIGVSGDDVEIRNASSKRNRRNGISVFQAARPSIIDCDCSDNGFLTDSTGLPGPFAGIDVEPDSGDAAGVKISGVKATGNQKVGIALWVRDEVQGRLQVDISDCEISGSPNCIWGQDEAVRAPTIVASVKRCKLTFGAGAAVKAGRGSVFTVGDADPANANTIDSATGGLATATNYGLQERDGGVVVKGANRYA